MPLVTCHYAEQRVRELELRVRSLTGILHSLRKAGMGERKGTEKLQQRCRRAARDCYMWKLALRHQRDGKVPRPTRQEYQTIFGRHHPRRNAAT